jgi:glutamine amidotransferase
MAAETGAGRVVVTAEPEVVARADRIVLPGDGAFAACRAALPATLHAALPAAASARRSRRRTGIASLGPVRG